jgi:diguanylate cyclase (GGDEF)-like protein/PAS domain S-box-containing protein
MQNDDAPQPLAPTSRKAIEQVCIRNLLATSQERLFFKDLEGRFLLVSAGFVDALDAGRSVDQVIGKSDFDLFSRPHAGEAFADEQNIIDTGEPLIGKVELETYHDRSDIWVATSKWPLRDDDGNIIGTFGISRDVNDQVQAQEALAHQALHDSLTGLANRVALMDRLSQALVTLERRPSRLALMFIDLDDFKGINDTLGHDVGDRVLAEVAQRLTAVARSTDTVARFGGDEFVLLCTELRSHDDLRLLCDRVVQVLRTPLKNGEGMRVTGSLGAVATCDPAAAPGALLQQADLAMYAAKRAGRNHFEIYGSEMQTVTGDRGAALELRHAIERGELAVVYQPLFRLGDGALTGVEALVRWHHPRLGVRPPSEFIPVAEQHGLIGAVDAFVLETACSQLIAWERQDPSWKKCTLAANISGRELRDPGLVDRVIDTLARHGIAPERLCLEITETAMMGELEDANNVISALSEHGVLIALDDFGTGYSTLAHLQRLRADVLKIDRSFVKRGGSESRNREIVGAVTAMAHALGMAVIGEGVETEEELRGLVDAGADKGQGYLLASPLPAQEVAAFWKARQAGPAAA